MPEISHMYTRSQKRTQFGVGLAVVSAISTAVLPQLSQLPGGYRAIGTVVGIIGAAAGATLAAINQSLSSEHVSVPVDEIEEALERIREDQRLRAASKGDTHA